MLNPSKVFSAGEMEDVFLRRTQTQYPEVWRQYQELVAHEKMSVDELHAFNFSKRQEILRFAYENTLFYRRLYDAAGVSPNDIHTDEDWEALPIVTKDDVRQHFEEMIVGGDRRS